MSDDKQVVRSAQDDGGRLAAALGRSYRIERELGQGGMATVYLARDLKHDREVAIKVLHPDLGAALGGERFLAEIRTTAKLQHPHILPLLDSGDAGSGLLYYVMPLVTGETLRARLAREKQLPMDDALRIAREVGDALAHAHEQGVIHRDIKPENILLQGGHAVVADFGIALAVQTAGGSRMTQTGLSLGTPQYMSPEQAMGEKVIDARSDVYALGAVTYEMLTGDPPFTGSTVQAIVAKVLTERPTAPSAVRDTVTPGVEAAVLRALAKLPADRFATARAFVDALTQPSEAGMPQRSGARGGDRAPAPRLLVALGVLAAVAVVASLGWWRATQRVVPVVPVRFVVDPPAGARLLPTQPSLALAPDGRTIALVAERADGSRALYVRTLGDVTPVLLDGTEGALQPFFSPDGGWIGFVAGQQLKKVPVGGGLVVTLTDVKDTDGASWGTGGLIFVANAGRLSAVPDGGGALRPLEGSTSPAGRSERYPVALPDGESVLYTEWGGGIVGARIMRRTLAAAPGTPVGIDDGTSLGLVDGWIIVGGASGVLRAAPLTADGSRVTGLLEQVLEGVFAPGQSPLATVASNGTLLYFAGSQLADLVLAGPRGDIAVVSSERRAYSDPRFSPDGKRIAVSLNGRQGPDIWVLDPAARSSTRLTADGRGNTRAGWSPDGSRVLYRSQRDSGVAFWWQRWDGGSAAERLYATTGRDIWEAMISPDGAWLLYRVGTSGTADIWYRRLSGDTTSRPFVATPATEAEIRFSPDGKWVAYTSNQSGTYEVYVRPFPTGDSRFQVSAGGGQQPMWSRDGRSVYYLGSGGGELLRAKVVATPSFTVASRDTVIRGNYFTQRNGYASYDVAPDGEHLLVVRRVAASTPAIVALGWFSEVRARLAREGRP